MVFPLSINKAMRIQLHLRQPECVAPRVTEAPQSVLYGTLRRPGAPALRVAQHSQDE